jgi:hypothetical protein
MKRLTFIALALFILFVLVASGCAPDSGPPPGEEVSTCVNCHSDKDLLKEVASEEEEEASGETSGEG